jgi:hypothetical protein
MSVVIFSFSSFDQKFKFDFQFFLIYLLLDQSLNKVRNYCHLCSFFQSIFLLCYLTLIHNLFDSQIKLNLYIIDSCFSFPLLHKVYFQCFH